jgi:hypothetical protein
MKKLDLALAAISLTTAIVVSAQAFAAPAESTSSISSKYSTWAGSKSNADSLVNGLRTGGPVTLVTVSPDNVKRIAGFTAQTTMTSEEISAALASAKRSLAGMGIKQPNAEQIQAALIGGEVALPNGKTKLVQGSVTLRAEPMPAPVASR